VLAPGQSRQNLDPSSLDLRLPYGALPAETDPLPITDSAIHLSWVFFPFSASNRWWQVIPGLPLPGSRHMRFLTVLRLTLHLLPFGPYFVPVALMGFYPSELFPLKEPVTSRCQSPLAVTSPTSNRLSGNKLADAPMVPTFESPHCRGSSSSVPNGYPWSDGYPTGVVISKRPVPNKSTLAAEFRTATQGRNPRSNRGWLLNLSLTLPCSVVSDLSIGSRRVQLSEDCRHRR
jgi:hypothetical protein